MKVLFVTRGFPSAEDPMAGNYEAVQAKAIAAKGHEVSVISIYNKPLLWLFNWGKITYRKVDTINVYEGGFPFLQIRFVGKLNIFFRQFSYKCAFKRFVSEQGMPDVVHAHILSFASSVIFLKEKYCLPFIITEHWSKINVPEIPQWLRTISNVYHKADAVICVSQVLSDSLKRNFQVDSIVIHNMVSNLFFQSSRKGRNGNAFRFIACGAFRENRDKGFDILVDAFAFGCFPKNVYLDIIGDGPDRPYIENKIVENHLDSQIKLMGIRTPDEVSDLLCHSDCFVLSSRHETFSIVVIEAMAKGLPVIATRCGGPETFLRSEHGRLVEKENVKELADAMNYMLTHYSDYNSEDIQKYCYNHFSQNVIADKIISIYKEVLKKNN